MANSTRCGRTIAALAVALLVSLATGVCDGQITFKSIDPRKMELVPLQKPIQPSLPHLPNPRLPRDVIAPDRLQFDALPKDNLRFQDLRPERLVQEPMPEQNLFAPSIAPQWLRRGVVEPPRMSLEAEEPRPSFWFQSPVFLPAVRPEPGLDDSMLLTPSLFSERPIGWREEEASKAKDHGPAGAKPQEEDHRRPLGW